MNEIIICSCGKAKSVYIQLDEDLFKLEYTNTIIKKDKFRRICVCKFCNEIYDHFDPSLVKIIKQIKL